MRLIKKIIKNILKYIINLIDLETYRFLYVYKNSLEYKKKIKNIKSFKTREELWSEFIPKDTQIQLIEFGVFKGASLNFFLKHNNSKNSKFFGFDSFEGLPHDWGYAIVSKPMKKEAFKLRQNEIPKFNDNRLVIERGFFTNSLKKNEFDKNLQTYVHFDCDVYSSTLFCLTKLDAILDNYIAIFDEFPMDESLALKNYCESHDAEIEFLGKTRDDVRVICKIKTYKL